MRSLAAFALLITASASAQAPAFEVEGPEAVVTAGRLPAAADRTGRSVTVLTAADIARSPARSLDELLRFEAGVLTTPRSAFGAQADLSVRGSTFNGVVVLVDGARFNDPMTGHFLSDFPVPLAEIARVEVVRGPEAAAWGPDALGGVVHVITHTGTATGRAEILQAEAVGGGLGTASGEVAARSLRERLGLSAAVVGVRTDGPALVGADGAEVVGSEGPVRADLDRLGATASGTAPLGAVRLHVRGALDAREFGAAQFYTPFPSDTAHEATSTQWVQARLASRPGRTTWSAQVAARRHTDRYTFYPGVTPNEHTTRRLGGTVEAARLVSPRLTLGAGLSGEARDVVSNSLGDHGDVSGGAFALARWSPVAPLTVSASARLDADPGFGVEPTPMLAVAVAAAPGVVLRAAAGRAVRAPGYVERYINTVAPRPSGNLGSPDLRAERAWNAEAGVDLVRGGLRLGATGFWRRTTDLIDYVRTEVGGEAVFLAQNVLGAEAWGVEATANATVHLTPWHPLRLGAAYTYTDVSIDPGAFGEGDFKYVLDHAPHLLQWRASIDAGHATLSVEALHKTRVGLDAVTVANARLGVALRPWPEAAPAVVYLEARNVFDATYTEVFGAPMPGRLWLAGVRVRLGRESDGRGTGI